MKYKILVASVIVLFFIFISIQYVKPYYSFRIKDDEQSITQSISELLEHPIKIKLMKDIDNKRVVLFTIGSQIGESELTKGPNNKYKLESAGHGSNEVRYRILKTDNGQYIKFLGRNTEGISKILAFVESEKYYLSIQEGEYFISTIPLIHNVENSFPSGSVWYDTQGNEIIRMGISNNDIL